jgi:hypothetical protein
MENISEKLLLRAWILHSLNAYFVGSCFVIGLPAHSQDNGMPNQVIASPEKPKTLPTVKRKTIEVQKSFDFWYCGKLRFNLKNVTQTPFVISRGIKKYPAKDKFFLIVHYSVCNREKKSVTTIPSPIALIWDEHCWLDPSDSLMKRIETQSDIVPGGEKWIRRSIKLRPGTVLDLFTAYECPFEMIGTHPTLWVGYKGPFPSAHVEIPLPLD